MRLFVIQGLEQDIVKLSDLITKLEIMEQTIPGMDAWIDLGSCCGCAPDKITNIEVQKYPEGLLFPWINQGDKEFLVMIG